ncbi:MAG: mechanosensitive ion channel family protein [Bacteroidota bacterium]
MPDTTKVVVDTTQQTAEASQSMDLAAVYDKVLNLATEYVPKVALAILVLIIGGNIIRRVVNLAKKGLENREMEPALQTFLGDLINVVLRIVLFIAVADMVGIETTSILALFGAAGLAVGLALQGSLSNFAGGVMILLFKPFRVGDLIEAQGHFGKVLAINIFITTLESPDSKTIIIPNGPLANGDITNYSTIGHLRVDLSTGIGYGENIEKAKAAIMKVMKEHPHVLETPAPSVNVETLADSSVNLAVRPYATPADYWTVYFDITEQMKIALDEAGVEIPFPQQVVHHVNAPQS